MTRRDLLLASAASLLPLPAFAFAQQKSLQLTGTVLYAYSECSDLILRVTEVVPEGGEAIVLSPPRAKRILLGDLSDPPIEPILSL
jgi:hypothetical protein